MICWCSVVDPNPAFWPNLDLDPNPGLSLNLKEKNLKIILDEIHFHKKINTVPVPF